MQANGPRRRTRVFRRSAALLALLTAGAAVNVVVAWGFAARRASVIIERDEQGSFIVWGRPLGIVQQRQLGMIDVWWHDLHDSISRSASAESIVVTSNLRRKQIRESGLPMPSGRPRRELKSIPSWGTLQGDPLPGTIYMGGDIAFGFPCVCLWMWTTSDMIGNSTANVQLHGAWLMRGQVESRANRFIALPHRPIWPGFAVNTLFYAAVLWVLFAISGALRRTIRRRRGQCAACGYPAGASPVCTECGSAVTPNTAIT